MNRLPGGGKKPETALKIRVRWYDYGARFYDPALRRWHVVDPLAEDTINVCMSPYCFSGNNPILFLDKTGMYFDKYYNENGESLGDDQKGYNIRIVSQDNWNDLTDNGNNIIASKLQNSNKTKLLESSVNEGELSIEAISKILTNIISIYSMSDLYNNKTTIWGINSGGAKGIRFNSKTPLYDARGMASSLSELSRKDGVEIIYMLQNYRKIGDKVAGNISWGSNYNNIRSMLYVHEYLGRHINNLDNTSLYKFQLEKNKELGLKVSNNYYKPLVSTKN